MSTLTGSRTTTAAPSFAQSTWLVAEREIGSKMRSKAFLISTIILFLGALALVVWGGIQAGSTSGTPIAVTADAQQYVKDVPGLEVTDVADRADAEALVESGDVDAAIVGDSSSPLGFAIIADESAPTQLILSLAQVPPVELLNPDPTNEALRYLVAIGFGVVFLLAASLFGGTIAQSVVEEKQTRVVELLISAIPVRALLAGKVIGNTVLAMAQILVLAGDRDRRAHRDRPERHPAGARRADRLVRGVLPLRVRPARGAVRRRGRDGLASGGHRLDDHAADDADHGAVLPGDLLQRQPDGARDHVVRAVLGTGRDADAPLSSERPSGGSPCCRSRSSSRRAWRRSWSARASTRTRCCAWARG